MKALMVVTPIAFLAEASTSNGSAAVVGSLSAVMAAMICGSHRAAVETWGRSNADP